MADNTNDGKKASSNIIGGLNAIVNQSTPRQGATSSLVNIPSRQMNVPLTLDVKKYMQFAPDNRVPLYSDAKYVQDLGAAYQGNLRRNLSAIPRMATTALFEVGQMAAVPLDFVLSGFNNNDPYSHKQDLGNISKGLRDTEEKIKEAYFPILYRSDYNDKSFLEQITSSEFVGDELAQGVGFFAGMMIPGAAMAKLGGFKALSRGLRRANLHAVNSARKSKFWRGLAEKKGVDLKRSRWMLSEEAADKAALHTYTAHQTFVEAHSEAAFAKEEAYNELMHKMQSGEINPKTGKPWTVQDVESAVSGLGSSIYWYNLAVLGASNTIMNNMLFGARKLKGYDLSDAMKAEKALDANKYRRAWDRASKFIGAAGKGILSEGFWEEGMQTAGEMAAKAMVLENKDPTAFGLIANTLNNYTGMLVTKEGQKSIFIGSLLGAGPSVLERSGEIKRAKSVYEALEESRNNLINVYLKPLVGDIYERDASGNYRVDEETGEYVLKVANILQNAEQQLGMQRTSLELQALAESDPEQFAKVIKEQIVPQLIKSYARFDETLEMLQEDLANELKEIRELHPDMEFIVSLDEIKKIGENMRQDRKNIQPIADFYAFSEEAKSDLQSENKEDQILPQQFAEEVIIDPYLDLSNRIRSVKRDILTAESEEDIKKLEEDLEKLEANAKLFEDMNYTTYNNLYKRWKKNRSIRIRKYERAALALQEASINPATQHLSDEAGAFWNQHHVSDVYSSQEGQKTHVSTSEFNLVDADGNVVDTGVKLMPPRDNSGLGMQGQGLTLFSQNNEYRLNYDNDGNPVITHVGTLMSDSKAVDLSEQVEALTPAARRNYETYKTQFPASQESLDAINKAIEGLNNSQVDKAKRKAYELLAAEITQELEGSKNNTKVFFGERGLDNHSLAVVKSAEDVAATNRRRIAAEAVETMSEAFDLYLEKIGNQGTRSGEEFNTMAMDLLKQLKAAVKNLDDVPNNLFSEFFDKITERSEDLQKVEQELSDKRDEIVDRLEKEILKLTKGSAVSRQQLIDSLKFQLNPDIDQAIETLTEQAEQEPGFDKTNFDKTVAEIKALQKEFDAIGAKNKNLGIEEQLKSDFEKVAMLFAAEIEETYGEMDPELLRAIATEKNYGDKNLIEHLADYYGKLNDPTIDVKNPEPTIEEAAKENSEKRDESDKPLLGNDPENFSNMIRAGLDEVSNEKQLEIYLRKLKASITLSDYERSHMQSLIAARRYHQIFRHGINRKIDLNENTVLISYEALKSGAFRREYGEVADRIVKANVLFFHGKTKVTQNGELVEIPKMSNFNSIPPSDVKEAMSDIKMVFINPDGGKLATNTVDPRDAGELTLNRYEERPEDIIFVSILSDRNLEGQENKPSFLFKQPGGVVEPRYRDLDKADVDKINRFKKAYSAIISQAKKTPIPLALSSYTIGNFSKASAVPFEQILENGTTISDFIKDNNLMPPEMRGRSFFELSDPNVGMFTIADKRGNDPSLNARRFMKPGFHYMNIQGLTTVLATKRLSDSDIQNFIDGINWISNNYSKADRSDIDRLIDHYKTKFYFRPYDQILEGAHPNSIFVGRVFGSLNNEYTIAFTDNNLKLTEFTINTANLSDEKNISALKDMLASKSYSTVYANLGNTKNFFGRVDFSGAQPEYLDKHDYPEYINRMADKLVTIFKKPKFTDQASSTYLQREALTFNPSAQFTPMMPEQHTVVEPDANPEANPDPSDVYSQPGAPSQTENDPNVISDSEAKSLLEDPAISEIITEAIEKANYQEIILPKEYYSNDFGGNVISPITLQELTDELDLIGSLTEEDLRDTLVEVIKAQFRKVTPPGEGTTEQVEGINTRAELIKLGKEVSELPFQERVPALIEAGVIDPSIISRMGNRWTIVVNIGGLKVPFYRSSEGTDGKIAGNWYPFFGFGTSKSGEFGWLIKGDVEKQILLNYDSAAIKAYSYLFNETLNWPQENDRTKSIDTHPWLKGSFTTVKSTEAFNKEVYGVEDLGIKNGENVLPYIESKVSEINLAFKQTPSQKDQKPDGKKLKLSPFALHKGVKTRVLPKAEVPVDLDHVLAWFKERHPDAEVTITDNEDDLGELLQGGDVIFSKREPDALYHEAWHRTSMYFLSPSQRSALYNEIRERLGDTEVGISSPEGAIFVKGSEMTDLQAEEYAADEFRKYMLYGENYKFPPKANKERTLLQRIFDAIVDFFKSLVRVYTGETKPTLEDLFYYGKTGKFEKSQVKTHEGILKSLPGFSSAESLHILSEIDRVFMKRLWSQKNLLSGSSIAEAMYNGEKFDVDEFWRTLAAHNRLKPSDQIEDGDHIRNKMAESMQRLIDEDGPVVRMLQKKGRNIYDYVREGFKEEYSNFLKSKGYGIIRKKMSRAEIEEELESVQEDLDVSNTNPEEASSTEESYNENVSTQSWNRSKQIAKTTPNLVKAFFEGVIPLHRLRDIPALEMQAMFTMKVVVQRMQGMPISEMGNVLTKLARQQRDYKLLAERWKALDDAETFGSEAAGMIKRQIYRAIKVTQLEFLTVSPNRMNKELDSRQRNINMNGFFSALRASRFVSGAKGTRITYLDSEKTGNDLLTWITELNNDPSVKGSLDKIEGLFGPIIRRTNNEVPNELLANVIDGLKKKIVDAFQNYAIANPPRAGYIEWSDIRSWAGLIDAVALMADLKFEFLDRTGDMSIPNLKFANQETRKYAMGENTHLTNIINDFQHIQNFAKNKSGFKDEAMLRGLLKEALIRHGFAKNTSSVSTDYVLHPIYEKSFIINMIIKTVNDFIDKGTEYELAENILMGFKDDRIGQSKAFEILSGDEIMMNHIKMLSQGVMPMVGAGGRTRESSVNLQVGNTEQKRKSVTDSSLFARRFMNMGALNQNEYVDGEDHLVQLFIGETARVLGQHALYRLNPSALPNAVVDNIKNAGEGSYNYTKFSNIYSAVKNDIDPAINAAIDKLIKSNDLSIKSLLKEAQKIYDSLDRVGVNNNYTNAVNLAIAQNLTAEAEALLENMPSDSSMSPYKTNASLIANGTSVEASIVPNWVIITPFKNVIIDDKISQSVVYPGMLTGGVNLAEITDANDPIFNDVPFLRERADLFMVNTALFGGSVIDALENDAPDLSPFLNHVLNKYNFSEKERIRLYIEGLVTKDRALQILKETQLLFKIATMETMTLSMGDLSSFGSVAKVTRRLEIQGSVKSTHDTEYTRGDRFDGRVSKPNTMVVNVKPDILGNQLKESTWESFDKLTKIFENAISRVSDPKVKKSLRSNYLAQVKAIKESDYEGTDALTHVSLDYYRELLDKDGSYPADFEKMYVYQMYHLAYAAIKINEGIQNDIEKGVEGVSEEDYLTMPDGTIVDSKIFKEHELFKYHGEPIVFDIDGETIFNPVFDGEIINLNVNHSLKSLKPQGSGQKEVNGQNVFVVMKTAFTPLIPTEHLQNDDMIKYIWRETVQKQADVISYESSVKKTLPIGVQEMNTTNFGLQFREPTDKKSGAAISKQLLALYGLDLYQNEMLSPAEAQEFLQSEGLFNDNVSDLVKNNAFDFFASMGVVVDFEKETATVVNPKRFAEKISEMSDIGGNFLDEGSKKQIAALADSKQVNKSIDSVIPGQLYMNVINSAVQKKVITLRDSSAKQFVQEPDTSQGLLFWRVEGGKIKPPQVKMPIPRSLEPWILNTFGIKDQDLLDGLEQNGVDPEYFNYQYAYNKFRDAFRNKDSRIPLELYQGVINRTPMDNRHSATPVEVADVLLPWEGSKIVVPMPLVYLYGFDFDFDKLTTYVQAPDYNHATGELTFKQKLKSKQDVVSMILSEIGMGRKKSLNKLLMILESKGAEGVERSKEISQTLKQIEQEAEKRRQNTKEGARYAKLTPEELTAEIERVTSLIGLYDNLKSSKKARKKGLHVENAKLVRGYKKQLRQLKAAQVSADVEHFDLVDATTIQSLISIGVDEAVGLNTLDRAFDISMFQEKKAIVNQLYADLYKGMLYEPSVFMSMIPTETSNISSISEKALGDTKPKEWSDQYNLKINADERSTILASGKGTGIFASAIPVYTRLQKNPLEMPYGGIGGKDFRLPIKGFDGKVVIGGMYDKNGALVSSHQSEFINTFLDATSNLSPFKAGVSEFVAPVLQFMTSTGTQDLEGRPSGNITPQMAMDIINQPIIKTFVKKFKSNLNNKEKFGSKKQARNEAFVYALAVHKINPMTFINPTLQIDSNVITVLNSEFEKMSPSARERAANAFFIDRSKALFGRSTIKSSSGFLFQVVERGLAKNSKAKDIPVAMSRGFGVSEISEEGMRQVREVYDQKGFDLETNDLRTVAIKQQEAAMLDAFATIMVYSDRFTNFLIPFRRDANLPNSLTQLNQYEETRRQLMSETTLFTKESVVAFHDGNYVKSYIKVNNVLKNFQSAQSLFYTEFSDDEIKNFFNYFPFQIGYDQIKEYFPHFLVQKFTPEIQERAKQLFFEDGAYADSLQGLWRRFYTQLQKEFESNPRYSGTEIEQDVLIKNIQVYASAYDYNFKKSRTLQTIGLSNPRIQGTELNYVQKRVAELTNPKMTENQDLVKAAKAFFDAAALSMIFFNSSNRFSGIGKVLVDYPGYTQLIDKAVRAFRQRPIELDNSSLLEEFAESIVIANAGNRRTQYAAATTSFRALPDQLRAKVLPTNISGSGEQFDMYETIEAEELLDSSYDPTDPTLFNAPTNDQTTLLFDTTTEFGLTPVRQDQNNFGDHFVYVTVDFPTQPDKNVTISETTTVLKVKPKNATVNFVYRRRTVPISRTPRGGYNYGSQWTYVGTAPLESLYAINAQELMNRRAQVARERLDAPAVEDEIFFTDLEESNSRLVAPDYSRLLDDLFDNEALFTKRGEIAIVTNAALQAILGKKTAESLSKKVPQETLVSGLQSIFQLANGQMSAIPSNVDHPMMVVLRAINDTTTNVTNAQLWDSYRATFTPSEGTSVHKAMEIFNAALEKSDKTIVKFYERNTENELKNEKQLAINPNAPAEIQPQDRKLFDENESASVVDAFYNFETFFEGIDISDPLERLAFLRAVDNGTISIQCKL